MILLSPWAKVTTDGKPSPKDYPYWEEVIRRLSSAGFEVHHVGVAGERDVPGVHRRSNNLKFREIERLLVESETWMSTDTYLPHLAWAVGKPGVAIFGQSDPVIFGHAENVNLLKHRKYLREKQFWLWSQCEPNPDAFVGPQEVVSAVVRLAGGAKGRGFRTLP